MPGDSQSLTFPGLYESPSNVNRSKFTEREAFMSNAQSLSHTKSKPYEVGMQISSHMDTEIPQERAIWGSQEVFRRSVEGASAEKAM